jgi:OOP family OmpA-OmpF porin
MRRNLLLALLALGCASAAQAAEPGLYVGAGLGNAGIEVDGNDPDIGDVSDFDFDDSDTGYKLFAGFRFVDWFGVEAGWHDFGEPEDSQDVLGVPVETEFETDGFDATLVGYLPVGDRFDFFAKVGMFHWDVNARTESGGLAERFEDDGDDLTYGIGAQGFLLGRLGLRAEYQVFDIDGVDDAWFLSGSLLFRF